MMDKEYLLSSVRLRDSKTDIERAKNIENRDRRNAFESDFGRVVFSSACRRLHDKTQVFPLTSDDNIHSRLTHSIEVMSIGRSFATDLFDNELFKETFKPAEMSNTDFYRSLESILMTTCMVHDIGNPPFGHFGETIIQNYFQDLFDKLRLAVKKENPEENNVIIKNLFSIKGANKEQQLDDLNKFLDPNNPELLDFTEFDGNAQGFRVLTKLQFLNDLSGLNLCSGTLAAYLKYPNLGEKDKYFASKHKHGVFSTEKNELTQVMKNCKIDSIDEFAYNRHPFSYLMEAADTICYLIMDYEDAISKGWLKYSDLCKILCDNVNGRKVVDQAKSHYDEADPDKKKIVQLRSDLMSYFVNQAVNRFLSNLNKIINGDFKEELLFDKADPNDLAQLMSDTSRDWVYSHKEIESLEITSSSILTGLMDNYIKYFFHKDQQFRNRAKHIISHTCFNTTLQEHLLMSGSQAKAWEVYNRFDPKNLTIGERFRIVRDFVSGMTDKFALSNYQKLTGQKI